MTSETSDFQIKDRLSFNLFILNNNLTVKNLFQVRSALTELLDSSVRNIVFDLEKCNEMDSSGLGLLSNLYKKINSLGGELGVLNVNPELDRIFQDSGLGQLLNPFSTLEEADEYFD